MSHKIPHGGTVSPEAFNELVDKVDRNLTSVFGASIRDSAIGMAVNPHRGVQPIYGVLTDRSKDKKRLHHYEFMEVQRDKDGKWIEKEGGHRSAKSEETGDRIFYPAVEINGAKGVELNTVVYLIPSQLNFDADGAHHREWRFSTSTAIKAFALTQDLIPTGGSDPDYDVEGYFLDDLDRKPVTLYPAHSATWVDGPQYFFSLGIGRMAGGYTRGTYGWAKWVEKAIRTYHEGEVIWEGQWQVVTLYAALIAEVRVYGQAIDPGVTGEAQLWWMDTNDNIQVTGTEDFALVNSSYLLKVTNTLEEALAVGTKLRVEFNRNDYRWYPLMAGRAIRRFELKYDLDPADTSATAHPLPWTGAAYVVDTDEDKEFEVYDPLKKFRGRGKDTFPSPHDQGSQGFARLMPDSGRWEIIDLTPNALMIRGVAKASWSGATMLIDYNTLEVMQPTGGLIVDQDPAVDFTVSDFFLWGGTLGDTVYADWDEVAENWKLSQRIC